MIVIDVSLKNSDLFQGCKINHHKGKLHLQTNPQEAVDIVKKNARLILEDIKSRGEKVVMITGAMTPAVYMTVGVIAYDLELEIIHIDKNDNIVQISAH